MKYYDDAVHDLVEAFEDGDGSAINILLPIIKNDDTFEELIVVAMTGGGFDDKMAKQIIYTAAAVAVESARQEAWSANHD